LGSARPPRHECAACSGGYLHLGFEFKGQPEDCMLQISVDQVVAAAQELLQSPVDLLA
jgi:hypothetical protein